MLLQMLSQVNYNAAPAGLPFPHFATKHIDAKPRHVLVLAHGSFFTLDVLSADGKPYSAGQIQASLQAIMDVAPAKVRQAELLGDLTTCNRDVWADARASIASVAENSKPLELIDSGSFTLLQEADFTSMITFLLFYCSFVCGCS